PLSLHDALPICNPDDPASIFAEKCQDPEWNVITISAFSTPNFTGEPVPDELAEVLVDHAYVEDMRREYGEESPTYISKVLGEFPEDSEDGVIRLSSLRACALPQETPRTEAELTPVELGVDFGAGGDQTVIRERRGVQVGRTWRTGSRDAMHIVGLVLQAIRETGATAVKCDVIGIGFGLVGRLRELGENGAHDAKIVPVNVSEKAIEDTRFVRQRSEIWCMGRQLAEDRRMDLSGLEERDRERLISQLVAPHYKLDSSGRVQVETKDDTRERINRSPDDADALLLAFYNPPGNQPPAMEWLTAAKRAAQELSMARRRRSRRRIERAIPTMLSQSPGGRVRSAEEVMAGIRGQTETGLAKPLPRDTYPYEFGPNIPLIPAPLDPPRRRSGRAEPRLWEYPVGWNLPGTGLGRLVPWKTLRDAANLPLIRDCIRIRKSEVQGLEWDFTLTRRAVDRAMRERPDASRLDVERELRDRLAADVDRAVDFWSVPDRGNGYTFAEWITQALEEHLVLDALAIYPRYTRGGDLYALEVLDGSTIKPLLDHRGGRPMPPQPAYQQILHGFPRGEFTADTSDTGEDGDVVIPAAYTA